MKYIVLIHEDQESGGYWGECPELPGCFSQGDTVDELMEYMKEAANLYFSEPMPKEILPVREIRELVL
jgi:predicted RNase H-like HicB family nuclease